QNGDYGAGGFLDRYVIDNHRTALNIRHTTIVDNKANFAVLMNHNSYVKILASIIHDASTGSILSGSSTGTTEFECSMFHEDASIGPQSFSVVDDPDFMDRDNRDYRLNAQISPAVDYCYTSIGSYTDIDFEERGWDDPLASNVYGPYDIGANETYDNDIIFASGLE
ncbi:MAG: hypothetical protein L3J52_08200, partial [Proteobacteria bacterium]|nr:hypothetical protein [Pseudomonadota bacterium]